MNHNTGNLACVVVLAGLVLVSAGFAQQGASTAGEVARYTFGQTRAALSAIEAEMRAAKPEQFAVLEERFLKLIQSADSTPDCKDWACRQLRFVGSEKSLETLAGLLASKELAPVVRQVLLTMPSKKVDKVLRDAVSKIDGGLRAGLIQTIGERRDTGAVDLIAAEIGSKDVLIAGAAIEALGRIGGDAAVKLLKNAAVADALKTARARAMLECADRMVVDGKAKDAAVLYLELFNAGETVAIKAAAFRGVLLTDLKNSLPLVETALKSESAKLRTIAAASLCEYGEAEMIRSVFAKLSAQPADVRVTLMSVVQDKAVMPAIVEAAGGDDEAVRIAALNAVGRLGDASMAPMLLKAASGEQGDVQVAARGALQRVKDKGVGAVLLSNAKSGEPAIRVESIKALKARADSSATADLLRLVDDSDKAVRAEAFGAIGELAGAANLPVLLKMRQAASAENAGMVEQVLIAVCRRLPDADATAEAVANAMAGSSAEVKISLLRVTGKIKSEKAVDVVKANIGNSDEGIKDAAIRSMADWPDASQIATVMEIAGKAESQVHKIVALRGAIRMIGLKSDRPAEQTVKLLADAMTLASTADGKKLVLAALGEIKHKSALDLAVSAASDKDVEVEAVAAVKKIVKSIGARSQASIEALKKIGEPVKAPSAGSQVTPANLADMVNIASRGTASSPDGVDSDGSAGGDKAAIDGDAGTYWDEEDGKSLYRLVVTFKQPEKVSAITIMGFNHENYAPKDFDIICDGKAVKSVVDAEYGNNSLNIGFPEIGCSSLELRITEGYGPSPAIRELGIYQARQNAGNSCRVLILSGSNNHDWKTTTPELKRILEESGLFTVDVTDAPAELQPDCLGKYKALISNWNTFGTPKPVSWPQPLKDAFTNFIQHGGGFVVMHAGSSVLYDWPDFQRLAGASWGKGTGHGPKHKFPVKVMDKEHPITAGVADFETADELWHRISTNNDLHVLAAAFSAKNKGGSGQDEPVAFTTQWGNGRCFNIVLGHDTGAMATSGFRELIVRGTEWAATGRVAGKVK